MELEAVGKQRIHLFGSEVLKGSVQKREGQSPGDEDFIGKSIFY